MQLGKARRAGSHQVTVTEDAIAECLEGFGFDVERQSFVTSTRRLYAGSLFGAGIGWVTLGLLPLLVLPVAGWIVTTIGMASLAAVSVIAGGIATGNLPFDAPSISASNIIARRSSKPTIWFVAHSDTKAQWLSLRGRVLATMLTAVGLIVVLTLLLLRLWFPIPWWLALPALGVLLTGSAGLSRPPLHGESPGAVDNGSGVIAALVAAERLNDRNDVGVLITGAEELGMEGARTWIKSATAGAGFVNFDGIDADGKFNVMKHRPARESTVPTDTLHEKLCFTLRERGQVVRDRALPFGIFVDGSVLAKGGLWGVTVSRGTWQTLSVVHTPQDTIERTDMSGAVEAGSVAAEVVETLLG